MDNPLIRKLTSFVDLTARESAAIEHACANTVVRRASEDLIREGERPGHVHLLMEGWAFRYKLLRDGGRQIMAYLIPGDLCDIHIFILKAMDHSIGLLSDATVALVPEATILALMEDHPRIAQGLLRATLVDEAILREWLANSLRREPYERVAHLLCEVWLRMNVVGYVNSKDACDLPLTQTELGDTIGLNSITVNRVLQRLRADGLITLRNGRLTILKVDGLLAVSEFNPNYLHLAPRQGTPRHS